MACLGAQIRNNIFGHNRRSLINKVIPLSFIRHGGSTVRVTKVIRWGPRKPPASQIPIQPLMYNEEFKTKFDVTVPDDFRHVFPEFLPDPAPEMRNRLRERVERQDMLARRTQIDIPEFYVGSILAITISDPNAAGKTSRFLGICIDRGGTGLRAWLTLRNVVDNLGVEINYEMYCPLITSIEIIQIEKRLDNQLYYLRDCPPEYSTFPQDMDPVQLPDDADVPLNEIKIKLRDRPWLERWDQMSGWNGIILPDLPIKFSWKKEQIARPWEKYDLMKDYRATIPEDEQEYIYREMSPHLPRLMAVRRKIKRVKISTTDRVASAS